MHTFIKKLAQFSIGPFLGAFISFITIPLTTYFISPEEYGKASLFMVVQVLLTAYLYLGIDQAYTREYNGVKNKVALLQNALVIPMGMAMILTVIFFLNISHISLLLWKEANQYWPIILLILSMYGMIFERFLLLLIRMEERALQYSFFTVLIKIIVLLLTLGILLLWRRDFLAVIYGTVGGQLCADVILLFIFKHRLAFCWKYFDRNLIKKMFSFGIPIFIAFSLEGTFTVMDRIALKVFSNFEEVGLYTVALKVASLMKIFQSSFTSFWVPTAYRWFEEKKPIYYFQKISDLVAIVFSIFFVVAMLCKNSIPLLFTENYYDIVYIIPYLLIVPVFYTISETTTLGIVFTRKTRLNIWVSVTVIIVNSIGIYFFVPMFGAKGAALSTGLAYFTYYCMRTFFSLKVWPGLKVKFQLSILVIILVNAGCNTFLESNVWIINGLCLAFLLGVLMLYIYRLNKNKSLQFLRL